ncbi:DEAD/DEAH box helicase family protein [Flavobacterium paronense]|uniref:DEAD/DEAH box helicase n=1 Tax=Flavobacterium paronense TaxID=1392775 RepID=A0ABV5GBJ7_9FLAO|nr:DEAD/DEAH box helicase family protein [Flavobacterium paronense]MDN3677669.1 DEAD/DEAH box helicase family protein [Flavobacterium paronense]
MELKSYQKQVIDDLHKYFEYLQLHKKADTAFNSYWQDKVGSYNPLTGEGMRPYQNTVPEAVHLSIKVPTAGGKTFIACNALKTIFDAMADDKPRAVVWLVPWSNLLDQTVKNLSNPDHPYCQKLNSLFNNRVQVFEKKDLLQGAGFNASSVREQLSVMVVNFSSIRAKNKEDRKFNEQNSNLSSFSNSIDDTIVLEGTEKEALINVIRSLNPILVVDESHNAESDLSVEMLNNLNPSFILDLTATPKQNANIVSLVSAFELKKEHMVKLPVIVYNHQNIEGVVESALHLQHKLELEAIKLEQDGGKYIRPIVLFQAQSKTKEENTTFDKLKAQLIAIGIPDEQIKIKTANKDELKGIDLMSRDCPVRYIITINALKEGWDCPFAYILASLADKSSEVDVTQILGRVLRQPYVMRHNSTMLNLSYVITASAKFQDTLQNIIKGLQQSGFSEKDYREKDIMTEAVKQTATQETLDDFFFPEQKEVSTTEPAIFDTQKVSFSPEVVSTIPSTVFEIEEMAISQNEAFEQMVTQGATNISNTQIYTEVGMKIKQYPMRESVAEQAKAIILPKFVIEIPKNEFLLLEEGSTALLDRVNLLKDFKLSDKDIQIPFKSMSSDLYKIDAEEIRKGEYKMSPFKIEKSNVQEQITEYILAKPKEGQIKDLVHFVLKQIDKMPPIADAEIKKYVTRILENLSPQELIDFNQYKLTYSDMIKKKINDLADIEAEGIFKDWVAIKKIKTMPNWRFETVIIPSKIGNDIGNSLYTHEGDMNSLEQEFIMQISSLENISFWHRNLGRGKGFSLNGFKSNHYPDFIIVTKSNKVILVETKGSDRDNSDSAAKLRLGLAWEKSSGEQYSYMMVFDKNAIEGAYILEKSISLIKQM